MVHLQVLVHKTILKNGKTLQTYLHSQTARASKSKQKHLKHSYKIETKQIKTEQSRTEQNIEEHNRTKLNGTE